MGKYIKTFSNHTNYEDFYYSLDAEFPNVSHCIQENDVHYNPLKHFAKLYNGSELIGKTEIVYDNDGYFGGNQPSTVNFYHSVLFSTIRLSGQYYTSIELDLFNGVSDVEISVTDDSSSGPSTSGFTYSMNGNMLRIESTEGAWSKINHTFSVTFTNSEGQESGCVVLINKAEIWA